MKFSDNPEDKKNDFQRVTPQSAMDDYFEDMFGSSFDDPLKSLNKQQTKAEEKQESKKNDPLTTQDKPQNINKLGLNESLVPQPIVETNKQSEPSYSPFFDEPERKITGISPLIIPAAFPKMAPVKPEVKEQVTVPKKVKTAHETKTSVSAKTKTEVNLEKVVTKPKPSSPVKQDAKVIVKPALDAKVALAILEKNRSKLSVEQIKRLEAKLAQQSKTHEAVQQVTKVIKPALTTPIETVVKPAQKLEIKPKAKEEVKTETTKNTVIANRQISDEVSMASTPPALVPAIQKDQRPEWTNRRFECLIFSVAGLKLAVPLISLGAIYKIEKEFIPLVGRATWFMGLYHHLDRNVRVIDTAKWVMPERCSPEVRSAYKFIIRLGGNDWGMACDAVHQSIQLYPEQVKWRTERTKRAWLFGTVIDHMCALIDADSLSAMLNEQATKNPRIFSQ